jgi:hypothetical protein
VVVNQGVPAAQVASATHAPLHPVALQAASAPSAASSRMDRFDPNHHTLTVYRPTIREPARPAATTGQNTHTGTISGTSLEKAPWQPVSAPGRSQSIAGRTPTVPQAHSGAHLAPPNLNAGQPTVQNGVHTPQLPSANSGAHLAPGSSIAQQPAAHNGVHIQTVPTQPVAKPPAQQNPTIISLKGPQSPSTASRPAWNPYTQNPTPWQSTTPAARGGFNSPAQTAMNVPQAPAQTQRPVPTYSGQYNQGYPAPNYQAPTRSAPVEVPRYNSNPQSHAYSPPAANNAYQGNHQSAPAYQAPPAQHYAAPAPSAAPARNSAPPPQQPRGDGGGGGNGRGR